MSRICILLSIFSIVFTQTEISGEVGGLTLTIEESPYNITGDISISPYDTLNIDPGVQLIFQNNFKLLVNGQLNVNGTEQDSVVFKGIEGSFWQGINFEYATGVSNISYADITNTNDKAINSYYSQDINIDNSYIHSFEGHAIYINDTFAEVTLDNILIEDGGSGTYIYARDTYLFLDNIDLNGGSTGIDFGGTGSFELRNSNISGASNYGVYISAGNYTHQVEDCIFTNNSDGLKIGSNTSLVVDNSEFINNSNNGFYKGSSGGSVDISNSLFQGNYSGAYFSGGFAYTVNNCEFSNHSQYGFYQQNNSSNYTKIIQDSNFFSNQQEGIYNNSSNTGPYIYNSKITNNGSYGVRGAYLLENCIVSNNGEYGVQGSKYINNSTIVNNRYGVSSIENIRNSIIFFNSDSQISSSIVEYSAVQGGYEGEGNIDLNPAFLDFYDFELYETSPCIDAGNPDPSYYDLCFPPSKGNAYNDMGAYGGAGACDWIIGAPPTQQEIILTLPNIEANPGDNIELSFEVSFPDLISVSSFALELDCFNNIDIVSFENGALTEEWYLESNTSNCPNLLWGAGSNSISSVGELFKIDIAISESAQEQFIPINISSILFDEYDFDIEIIDGGITIIEETPDPPLVPNYGDVSLNGNITPFDASMILKQIVGLEEFNDQQFINSDVSGDSTITSMDASYILQYGVGLINQFPAQDNSVVVNASGDYSMELYSYNNDLNFEIPIFLENGSNLFGFEHHFIIDPSIITIESISPGENIQDFIVQSNLNENKYIVAGASSNEDGITGTFFTLSGTVNQQNLNSVATTINLEKIQLNENGIQLDNSNYTTLIINGTKGDIYIDEVINVIDIVSIVNYIFETLTPSTYQEWASDINNDLEINVVDIVALVNMIFEQNYN